MTGPTEINKVATPTGAESPTTARPFEMDDDDVQESGVIGGDRNASPAFGDASGDVPPPKPPRPLTETQKNTNTLKEAFPTVDEGVIKAVLRASGGKVEPAFNALLEMTDPDAVKDEPQEVPPQQPPRPQGQAAISQVESDELYARQLAEHYDSVGAYEARTSNRGGGAAPGTGTRSSRPPYDENDRDHSFLEDDFPIIRENLRQGFLETQTKVNGWINTLKKKIEENFDESEDQHQAQRPGQPQRRPGEPSRRSNDYNRYDADPQVLSDDFAGMKFSADGTPANRPMANTGIYRPPPATSPRPSGERRVVFKEETEEINMYDSSPRAPPKDSAATSGGKASKWQPLSAVDPNPIIDNDPFSLGDSEDEKETKEKAKDGKADGNERLKQAAAEAMSDSLVGEGQSKKS